jgi:predicted transposase/invertase (TIGR01784 family)
MAYDNTCKFIAETFSADIATWLLGADIALTKLEASELSVEPIRPDALILLESENLILHIEFQTDPKPDLPFRVADYRLRGYRRYPHKQMRQVVVYLRKTTSPLVYQTTFELANLRASFEVIRLWEQPTDLFLSRPGLLPFAVLTQAEQPVQVLRQVAQRVAQVVDGREQSNLTAASGILAGLILDKDVIRQVLRQDVMRESVIYQEIRAEGKAEGKTEGEKAVILKQLTHKLDGIQAATVARIDRLSVQQLENLGEALLDFSEVADLMGWLDSHVG